jgi:surface antigen
VAVDQAVLAQAAAQYGIPPAILYAVGQQMSGFSDSAINGGVSGGQVGAFGVSPDTARSLGYQPGQLSGDIALQAAVAAQLLSTQFQQYGNWNMALSAYLTGDPQAGSSPTSSVGGQINGILGVAGSRSTYGLNQMGNNVHMDTFLPSMQSFADSITGLSQLGGVVSQANADALNQATDSMVGGGVSFGNAKVSTALQAAAKNNGKDYALGQCTYYVARSLGYIPGDLGNAADWAQNAAKQGFQVGQKPTVGDAVVYGGGGGYSPQYGHVAVVQAVNPDGTFTVSEMNVEGNMVADTRTSTMQDVIGFINPPAGTNMATAAPGIKQAVRAAASTPPQVRPASDKQSVQPEQGKTAQMQKQANAEPTPTQISEFASRAQALGLTPDDIQRVMPQVAPLRHMLLEKGTDLSDLVPHLQSTPAQILESVRSEPHPMAPQLSAGQMVDSFQTASLHSIHTVGRMPYSWEAAQFASAGFKSQDMLNHYQSLAAAAPKQDTGTNQEQGKILQMGKGA